MEKPAHPGRSRRFFMANEDEGLLDEDGDTEPLVEFDRKPRASKATPPKATEKPCQKARPRRKR
jgi:hypothetical protein